MRTTSRRRLDVLLLGVGAAAAGAITAIGGIAADNERITHMWAGAALQVDSSAEVIEVIDYDFGLAQEKHGILREIPGLAPDAPVAVESDSAPDGIAARTPTMFVGIPGIELRIGDPDITITGRHRYRIEYPLPEGVVVPRGRGVDWNAVGQRWDVGIAKSEIHVVAPWELLGPRCHQGPEGSTDPCSVTVVEPGHLVVEVDSLGAGEGVRVEAERGRAVQGGGPDLPAPPASAPPDPGAGLLLPAAVAVVTAGGASAVSSRLVRRRGRERVGRGGAADAAWAGDGGPAGEVLIDHEDLVAMATTEVAPPEGLRAPMGGVVHAESVEAHHKVAWLIDAAIDGAVELVDDRPGRVRLLRTAPGSQEQQRVLDKAFGGRTEVELGEYDAEFASGWTELGAVLERWRSGSGLWDLHAERRRVAVRALGALATVVGAAGVAAGGALASRWGESWLVLVAAGGLLAGAGLAAAIRGWELRVRTPKGSGLWLRVESFRRFLAASEAHHAEEAAERGVLREYTAWAVALGEIDRWEQAVSRSTVIPAQAGIGYAHMAPVLIGATAATSTAPSSSGGSGGGGGGVGGGGGGGGGGSW